MVLAYEFLTILISEKWWEVVRNSEKSKELLHKKHVDLTYLISEKWWIVVRSSGKCNKIFSYKHAHLFHIVICSEKLWEGWHKRFYKELFFSKLNQWEMVRSSVTNYFDIYMLIYSKKISEKQWEVVRSSGKCNKLFPH